VPLNPALAIAKPLAAIRMKILGYILLGLVLCSCNNHSKTTNSFETVTSEYIGGINTSNEQMFSEAVNSAEGQKIDQVYYGIVNYQERPYHFDGFHLCDQAVLIKLSNGKWLNWVWVEEGYYQTSEINISTLDIRNKLLDEYTEVKNVSESNEWKNLVGKRIDSIKFKTVEINGNKHISDLKLTIDNKHVSICAIDEPDPFKLPKLGGMPYSANWTIVVFDDKILEEHNRIIK